jgi:hypothetical protein
MRKKGASVMMDVLAYLAAALIGLWGTAHVIPTGQVLAGFEPITPDNRRILTQEWIAEAVTMWGLAATVIALTAAYPGQQATEWVYRIAAALVAALGVLTALTGARTPIIWFKICVVLLGAAAGLLLAASLL